jgi:hypothetical protein
MTRERGSKPGNGRWEALEVAPGRGRSTNPLLASGTRTTPSITPSSAAVAGAPARVPLVDEAGRDRVVAHRLHLGDEPTWAWSESFAARP